MTYAGILVLFLFLAANLLSQLLLPKASMKNAALLVSSLLFYGWAGPAYLLLLAGLSLVFWLCGLLIQDSQDAGKRKALLIGPIVLAVTALVVFRYGGLILSTTQSLFDVPKVLPKLAAPLGIAIYTLQLISYLVDVYRGDVPAEKKFWVLLTYSSLFHVSVGGPVLRYRDLRKALSQRRMHPGYISAGISRFALGFAKKFVLADSLALVVDQLLIRSNEGLATVPVVGLWIGVILSAIRVYLTFSGYADMALGLGFMSGLRYAENFDYPFLSASLSGFLSKWMCSVTSFFQDYVLLPLTNGGKNRGFVGLLVSCSLMGLWYGGSWNYLILGVYLALFLYLEQQYFSKLGSVPGGILGVIGIFLFFLLFSFTTLPRLGIALMGMIGLNGNGFFHRAFFAIFPKALPVVILSVLFCLPIGRILHNLYYTRFKDNLNLMTVASLWETVYPILLLIAAVVCILRGWPQLTL